MFFLDGNDCWVESLRKSCGLLLSQETAISRCPHRALALHVSLLWLPGASFTWRCSRCQRSENMPGSVCNPWAGYLPERTWSSVLWCETFSSYDRSRIDGWLWSIASVPALKWCSVLTQASHLPTHCSEILGSTPQGFHWPGPHFCPWSSESVNYNPDSTLWISPNSEHSKS